jgi:RNA polymerase sigma factor (sigma-70 family)
MSYKPQYGVAKYARLFMMRAVSRIADRRRRARPLAEVDNVCSKAPTPPEHFEQLQTAEDIRAEISRLSDNLREPIWCVFYDGMNVAETAEKLGTTPNAVRLRLFRARGILRRRLERFRE